MQGDRQVSRHLNQNFGLLLVTINQYLKELNDISWENFKNFRTFLSSLSGNHILKSFEKQTIEKNEMTYRFLWQIEEAFTINEHDEVNKPWFNSKLNEIKKSTEKKQISSNLGELRAYSVLKYSEFGKNLQCMNQNTKGCDFKSRIIMNKREIKVCIEVNTPLGRDDPKRTTIDHGTTRSKSISITEKEIAPFGLPQRQDVDSIGSEVLSKLNSIKEDEDQFGDDAVNILFVDFVNPLFSGLNLLDNHGKPFQMFHSDIYTGNIWFAMYSKKNENIPFNIGLYCPSYEKPYKMEYDGKLTKKSKLDFVIFNTFEGSYIYEKNIKHHIPIKKEVYLSLYTIPRRKYEDIWLNYPFKDLSKRINYIKKATKKLLNDYHFFSCKIE